MTDEIGRYFTLCAAQCSHEGCEGDGLTYGYCEEHYHEQIDLRSARLAREGRTRPAPPCFTEQQWREYEVHALEIEDAPHQASTCKDCLPERQRQMAEEGRCTHEEVVFVIRDGGVEGITSERFNTWDQACRGERGKVVQMPLHRARQAAVYKHFQKGNRDVDAE